MAKKAKQPSRSPHSSDEDASGPPQEDASGPPQGEDASGPPLDIPVDVPAAPAQPAIDDLAPPAPSELAQVLAALAAQAQQMLALQAELKEQKRVAKAAEKAHADEGHIRAMLAQAEAEKGRVMPIGAFVPAGLIPDPPSPGLPPSGVSRASQADPSRGPAPTTEEKKRARAAFTGGGGAAASRLYSTEPGAWAAEMPPRPILLKPATLPKARSTTPPLPKDRVNISDSSSSDSSDSCGQKRAPATPPKKLPTPSSPSAALLKDVVSKGWTEERAREALLNTAGADERDHATEAVRYALNKWPAGPLDYLLRRDEAVRAKEPAKQKEGAASSRDALLALHPLARKTVQLCLELHDRGRGQHSSDPLVAASSIRTAAKQADKRASDDPYLEAAAAAIAVDCALCHALLEKKNAAAAEATAAQAAKLLHMQKVVLPFPSSKGAYVPATPGEDATCDECGLGHTEDNPASSYVRLCEGCPRKYHDSCVQWARARDLVPPATYINGKNWVCDDCQSKHPDRQITADRVARRKTDRDDHGNDPDCPDPDRRPPPPGRGSNPQGRGGAAAEDRRRPTDQGRDGPPKRAYVPHNTASQYRINSNYYPDESQCSDSEAGLSDDRQPPSGSGKYKHPKNEDKHEKNENPVPNQNGKNLGVVRSLLVPKQGVIHQMEKFFIWESTNSDKKIADARCGWTKNAWLHHRRHNVPICNQARDAGYHMGPLKNALSLEMKRSVRTKLSNSTVISGKKSPIDIELWFASNPNWFEEMDDDTYIKAMDDKFQMATPAALFRLRITNDIRTHTADGYPYYPEKEFSVHTDQWINLLAELQDLDHDLSEKNLKDAFIESIRPHKLLFNEASRMGTQNVTVLIVTLSDWLTREQQKCTDVLNAINDLDEGEPSKRKKMIPEETADQAKPRETNYRNPQQAHGRNVNQAVKAFLTMFEDTSKAHPETQSWKTPPLAPLTGPGTNRDAECNQCGNWWDSRRKTPCQPVCKYSRHPKFKARPKNAPWPKNEPALTFKGVPYDQIDEETKRGWDRMRNLKIHPGSRPEYRRDRA